MELQQKNDKGKKVHNVAEEKHALLFTTQIHGVDIKVQIN